MDSVFTANGIFAIIATIIVTKTIEKGFPFARDLVLKMRRKSRLNSLNAMRKQSSSSADYQALLSVYSAISAAFFVWTALILACFLLFPSDPRMVLSLSLPTVLLEIGALYKKTQVDKAKSRLRKIERWKSKTLRPSSFLM